MKKSWIVSCAVLFIATAGFAQAPRQAPLTREALSAILGLAQPGPAGACPRPSGGVLFAAKGPHTTADCSATANCGSGTVSCSGSSSCSAFDSDCSIGQAGQVTCDGVTTQCPACVCGFRDFCCQCGQTGDCITCCRCNTGGTIGYCASFC